MDQSGQALRFYRPAPLPVHPQLPGCWPNTTTSFLLLPPLLLLPATMPSQAWWTVTPRKLWAKIIPVFFKLLLSEHVSHCNRKWDETLSWWFYIHVCCSCTSGVTRATFFPLFQSSLTPQLVQSSLLHSAGVQHPFYHKLFPHMAHLIPFPPSLCLSKCASVSVSVYVSVSILLLPFETGSHNIASLEFTILLAQPPEC